MGCGEFLVKYILFFANLFFAVSEVYFYVFLGFLCNTCARKMLLDL